MPSDNKYIDYDVKCPFYNREDKNKICCDGFTQDDFIQHIYRDKKEKDAHKKAFCRTFKYDQCPIAAMLTAEIERK